MTFRTRQVGVLAREGVRATSVIEFRRVLPTADIVTARALTLEASAMHVRMTARAAPLESNPARTCSPRRQGRDRRDAKLRLMAGGALGVRVTLLERVGSAALMIEALRRSPWPLNELEVSAGVIGVAGRAVAAPIAAGVKATSLLAQPGNLAVTIEAPSRRRLGAATMALRATQIAVERDMGARQWTRRDLRAHDRRDGGEQEQRTE
jgi:hypothetical protein